LEQTQSILQQTQQALEQILQQTRETLEQALEQTRFERIEAQEAMEKRLLDAAQGMFDKLAEHQTQHWAAINYLRDRLFLAEQGLVCPRLVRRARGALRRIKQTGDTPSEEGRLRKAS
jgi:hypothetical protein